MVNIDDWYQAYKNLPDVRVHSERETEGICQKTLGARALFARIRIEIGPSDTLEFKSVLHAAEDARAIQEGWFKAICLGVLDVMLVRPAIPITIYRCTLKELHYHQIDSSVQAFRLAARYATEAFLEKETFVTL